jgi:hypothetical protein
MSIQIKFTNLTDCGTSETTDFDSGIVEYNFDFKNNTYYERLEGNGYFEKNYPHRNEGDNDLLCGSNYCEVVVSKRDNIKNISARIHRLASSNGFFIHRVVLSCSDTFFKKIKENNVDGNLVQVNIKLSEFVGDYYDKVAEAEVEQIIFDNNSKDFGMKLIEKEIEDIKFYIKNKNCLGGGGQVSYICNEFAESFRQLPKKENKIDLMDEITNLISSYRYHFHSALSTQDSEFIANLKEKYDFNIHPENNDFKTEFAKLTDKKEFNKAINIFNHLWTTKKADQIFKNGFPFSVYNAQELADDYLKLKYVKSEIIEKILIDLLITTSIAEKASSLQYHKHISVKTLLSIPMGFYKKENNSMIVDMKFKELIILLSAFLGMHLFFKVILSLFYWWFSGLIAGDNETAHIILFGLLFSTDWILTYIHHKSEDKTFGTDVPSKLDEKNFYLLRNLCNLHSLIDSYKSSSFKSLLHKVSKDGTLFPSSLYSIVK